MKFVLPSLLLLTSKLQDLIDIPIEFYKALISDDDDNDDANNILSTGMNCLLLLYNRIWNGDFLNSWNEASIVSF